MKNVIEISNLFKYFDEKCILQDINLNITEGESCVIIGSSGSGKSVLIKTIVGIYKLSSGIIKIYNEELRPNGNNINILSNIAFSFQNNALFDSLPIWKNIGFKNFFLYKQKKSQVLEYVEESLKKVDLNLDIMYLFPNEISGGMQKRVSIARALVDNPKIIFFDEPTSGLDPITSQLINELIVRLNNTHKITTITITHDLKGAVQIANPNLVMINKGKIIFHGNHEQFVNSENIEVKKLLEYI